MKEKILIVDDEKDIVRMLEYNLKKEGFRVLCAFDGESAVRSARHDHPDIIILDLMLPGIDGFEVCRQLKKEDATRGIPLVMLSAKAQEADKIVGLELGADDYITKPFSPRELTARIKAVLRRVKEKEALSSPVVMKGLVIDSARVMVESDGKPVELTAKEFELLKNLVSAKGRVLSRDYLLDAVWGFDHAARIQTRTVDVHVRTLRKKLKNQAKRIITVKSYGYRFLLDEE
jgi:two-component system, OmpR family, alkaline phosphatase synthesis response regulator PhoP